MDTTNLVVNSEVKSIQASRKFGETMVNFSYQLNVGENPEMINFSVASVPIIPGNENTNQSPPLMATPSNMFGMGNMSGSFMVSTGKLNLHNFEATEDNLLLLAGINSTITEILTSIDEVE